MDPNEASLPAPELPAASEAVTNADAFDADDPFLDMGFIGSSDQACKECRRRKARCNRALPTCDLCVRYRRHCLYEKHSRTPLTRKHLTEVEARLERAEVLLKQMRTLVPPHLRSWERRAASGLPPHPAGSAFDFASSTTGSTVQTKVEGGDQNGKAKGTVPTVSLSSTQVPRPLDPEYQRLLEEGPPLEDFEWNENDSARAYSLSPDSGGDGTAIDDAPLSDGMASLTVNERESGYLGVASGAALLRMLEPQQTRRRPPSRPESSHAAFVNTMTPQPNPNRHIAESMIDAYFRLYHVSYPLIHEPTFRAQYSEVIARPNGACWTALAYIVAAIGVWTSSSSAAESLDMALFAHARSILGFNFLECGNLSLVQALTLASNYQQKRDKPNSGYNYLGLSVRMAMGLGLHKEFQGWNIPPLNMEIRRRIWWTLCSFDIGASITFSRPDVWPIKGVEVAYPLNVNDKDLTAASQTYPTESNHMTPYTAAAWQARFHIATHECYQKVISKPFPSAAELLELDSSAIEPWESNLPKYFATASSVLQRYALPQAIMELRTRNLRIIMYRPFVIRRALRRTPDTDEASTVAYGKCLAEAKKTIETIDVYWEQQEHNRLAAWYGLYFLFQAALIPCICLRNDPAAEEAADWRKQIAATLKNIAAMSPVNASCARCYQIISELCGRYMESGTGETPAAEAAATPAKVFDETQPRDVLGDTPQWVDSQPVGESPETQINHVFSMLWPNVHPLEAADVVMGDDIGWMEFLRAGSADNWDNGLS